MKKAKNTIYFRYEFSDEAGLPEGGDIFQLNSMKELQEMTAEILKVAHSDNVAVNLTIGEELPFFGFLKTAGMTKQDIEKELVDQSATAAKTEKKNSKKAAAPKAKTKTEDKSKDKSKTKPKAKSKAKSKS